jgi:alanine racemase
MNNRGSENMKSYLVVDEPAWVEVDLDKLRSNIAKLRSCVPGGTKMMAVVKAQGYGTGAEMAARTAIDSGVDMLAVARVAEGIHLRQVGIKHPILNFGYPADKEIEPALENDLINTIYNLDIAEKLQSAAAKINSIAKVHINIDTGMGRIGIRTEDVEQVISKILQMKNLKIEGLYSHFPSSDEDDKSFSHSQIATFRSMVERIGKMLEEKPLLHMATTAAILMVPESHFDMVRPGIGLYGAYGSDSIPRDAGLELVAALKARVGHVKRVAAGTSISYGRQFVASEPTTIATLPIGYGDGVDRRLSNKGEVIIQGKRFPIVGRVTMDQIMIDVGDDVEVKIGDVATLMGRNGNKEITADDIAQLIGTIANEVLTSLGVRLPRVYIDGGQAIKVLRNGLI